MHPTGQSGTAWRLMGHAFGLAAWPASAIDEAVGLPRCWPQVQGCGEKQTWHGQVLVADTPRAAAGSKASSPG
jgi:hypothetical protein